MSDFRAFRRVLLFIFVWGALVLLPGLYWAKHMETFWGPAAGYGCIAAAVIGLVLFVRLLFTIGDASS